MKTDKEIKCLSTYVLRGNTESGDPSKTEVYIYSDGRVDIWRSVLSVTSDEIPVEYKRACTKFGKDLLVLAVGFKYDTLMSIAQLVNNTLGKYDVKREDILK